MRRVAILGDIHGNLPALDAVLAHVRAQPVDEVLVSGDLVGRGPAGTAVTERIMATGWRSVRGNHEDYTLAFKRDHIEDAWRHEEEWAASRWMGAELSDEAADWLEALPLDLHSSVAPTLWLTHGTPASNRDGLMPETPDRVLEDHLDTSGQRVILCGHTHRPMHRSLGDRHVINVGSVGLPFNRDTAAQYAIVTIDEGHLDVAFQRVPYDVDETLRWYERSGFLEEGGITSTLLAMELRHASPCLVPFLAWARRTEHPATRASLPVFLERFRPGMTIREMIAAFDTHA